MRSTAKAQPWTRLLVETIQKTTLNYELGDSTLLVLFNPMH